MLPPWLRSGGSSSGGGGQDWQLAAGQYEPAVIPLEIIAPRTGLATYYRYYKAYPGILYEVPIVVLGGAAPFKYELTAAPSGMTIGEVLPSDYLAAGPQQYGLIRWSNPTTSGSPHTVTVKVTDQEGTEVTVSWSLTVTTTGFIFIDSVNGNRSSANGGSGDGTINNPFLGIRDWYAGSTGGTGSNTKSNATYQGFIVYYREGSYRIDDAYVEDSQRRMTCGNGKPKVHLGYPGETAEIDYTQAIWNCESGPLYFGELTFAGLGDWANSAVCQHLTYGSSQSDFGAFKISCGNLATAGAGGANASVFFAVSESASSYHWMSHCNFGNMNSHDIWLAYKTTKIVIQWNTVSGILSGGNAHGFYWKDSNKTVSARFNRAENSSNSQRLFRVDGYNSSANATDFDISHNVAVASGDTFLWGTNGGSVGTTWERRNTWRGGNPARSATNAGTLNTARNVIRYSTSVLGNSGGMTVNVTDNLQATSGLIDSSNLLTGTDRTNYLNIRGHEIVPP